MGMLYAKTLLLNQKYRESDLVLSQLKIIPLKALLKAGRCMGRS
jgi:hypothetical protein